MSLFTKTPDLIYGASHILVKPDHFLAKRESDNMGKLISIYGTNPFNKKKIPIFVEESNEYFDENLDSHLAIPDSNELDKKFATKYNINWLKIIDNLEPNTINNSGEYDGLLRKDASEAICNHARKLNIGGFPTSAKLRDWLISRQRYWGTPIPIIHCPKHGVNVLLILLYQII